MSKKFDFRFVLYLQLFVWGVMSYLHLHKKTQRSSKHTHKTKDRVIRTSLKTKGSKHGDKSWMWKRQREVLTKSGTCPGSFVTQILHNGQPSHGGNRKTFEVMTSTYPRGTLCSVAFLLAVTLYQGTTGYGISDQLRDAYSICRCCWNIATYKWKVHNSCTEGNN